MKNSVGAIGWPRGGHLFTEVDQCLRSGDVSLKNSLSPARYKLFLSFPDVSAKRGIRVGGFVPSAVTR